MPETVELEGDAHDILLSYQRDDEDLSETLARVVPALIPHAINFDNAGIDHEQLDSDSRFVLERWPDGDGHSSIWVYDSKTAYLRANKVVAEHTTLNPESVSDGDHTAPDTVNSVTVIDSDDGGSLTYDGPFSFLRDGGEWEITLPVDPDDRAGIHETTAENLTERVGDFAIAWADGSGEASGKIVAADVLEADLLFRVNDPTHVDPADIDLLEVDA